MDDTAKHAELVKTLTQYLEHGGNYDATALKLSVSVPNMARF